MTAIRNQSELERTRNQMLRLATVQCIDPATARARVTVDGGESALVPWLTTRAGPDVTWWAPAEGEQVMLFAPDGDPGNGVILPGVYCNRYPAPRDDPKLHTIVYRDSAAIQYDTRNHRYIVELPDDPNSEIVLIARKITLRGQVKEEKYKRELNDEPRPDPDRRCGEAAAEETA